MIKEISRVWNTVRYMTPRQWKYRLYYTTRNKLKKRVPKNPIEDIEPRLLLTYYSSNVQCKDTSIADGILKNLIPTVSGLTKKFDGDWDLKGEEYRLVCFKLNSFRWLLDLSDAYKTTGDQKYIDKGLELISIWQEKCGSIINGDKWNAYVIAERIENWIGFCTEYAADDIQKYAKWIYSQAQELKDSLEYQLGANHLLSEGKALVFAGVFLKDDEMYRLGKKLLVDEAKEQFLPDGGHYERSVSYHVESLQQYFEAYAEMKIIGDSDAERFAALMREPYKFLNSMIGVNGRIPLFNDSAYDYPFYDASDLLATASYVYTSFPPKGHKGLYYNRWSYLVGGEIKIEWDSRTVYENTGFVHYQFDSNGKSYSLFMDCGNNGPDYNLGHAHADALGILLYSEDKEILVDSGVFSYKSGEERNACRLTKAHNTVEIDGQNSAEVWSTFRVAKRGYTKILNFSETDGLRIKALHDGYEKTLKAPVKHIREVTAKDGWIQVYDVLEGKGRHNAISRFHVGPDCKVVQSSSYECVIDEHITIQSDHRLKIVDCEVAGMFGNKQPAKCIEIGFKKSMKATIELYGEK